VNRKMLKFEGVGERLREERERLGLNQTDFGVLTGVSRGTLKAYELGKGSPDIRYLSALAKAGVNVSFVLTGLEAAASSDEQSQAEAKLLNQYRVIPESDKEVIHRIIGAMAELAEQKK
jgi:transcriptional regulator with XRE-family HTH domain